MDSIHIGHPFYFPTQAILVDDDPDFLEGIGLLLDKNQGYRLFRSATEALSYVNTGHKHVGFLQRCYTSYKTGPHESDALTHIDIGKLHLEVLNAFRFQTCSTVVVDYSMPEMNGLDFLQSLENPYIRKVLLTGQADMEIAVHAFNQQLIDQFIDKHDPKLKQKLNSTIHAFHEQYLHNSFKLITDPILANNQDGYLTNIGFQEFFRELRNRTGCVEYYLLDNPRSGFLMLDKRGRAQCLLIWTIEAVEDHILQLEEIGAPRALIDRVKDFELLPAFETQPAFLSREHPCIKDWQDYYLPATRTDSTPHYFVTLGDDSLVPSVHGKKLYSFEEFLQANGVSFQTRH